MLQMSDLIGGIKNLIGVIYSYYNVSFSIALKPEHETHSF